MRKPKLIKVKRKSQLIVDIQNDILKNTNAGLISIELHFAVRKFINSLSKIYLSQELQ